MIKTSLDLLWKSSAIFGNFWEMFGNVDVALRQLLENLQTYLESGWKSLENVLTDNLV